MEPWYISVMEYRDVVRDVLSDEKLHRFTAATLNESMRYLGFSEALISEFLHNLNNLDVPAFIEKHKSELEDIELGHFFRELVPEYFSTYVVPEVPEKGKILDLGCGLGTLLGRLVARGTNRALVGIDIKASPEWESLERENVRMEVIKEDAFLPFLENEQPDIVTATWVFHHMEYDEQERYLRSLYAALKEGAAVVVLEDSYAQTLSPESGEVRYEAFMELSPDERLKVMGALDWIANRIFSMRTTMPVPFAYRTLEDWKRLFEEVGFTVTKTRFLGFPENRDVNTPQSVLVAHK